MRYQECFFSALVFGATTDGEWQFVVGGVQTAEWHGALLYLGGNFESGDWGMDLLWLRQQMLALIEWWRHG